MKPLERKDGISSQAAEKLIDIPYDTRIFKKDKQEVAVAGFRERLQAAVKQYETSNRETFGALKEMLNEYQETLLTLEESVEYDVHSIVNNAVIAQKGNEACFQSLNQIVETIGAINQMPFDFDEASGQIIEQMLQELAGVGALNASNEALKTLDEYKADFDDITVNFYRVVGGKDKGERTREYYTEKRTKVPPSLSQPGKKYQEAIVALRDKLEAILSNSETAAAELQRFAKEAVEVLQLWEVYSKSKPTATKKNPQGLRQWKGEYVTDQQIEEMLQKYPFYQEIADKLSFRKMGEEGEGPVERKLHAMRRVIAMLRAKAESIVNAPAYAAGIMSEYTDSATDFGKDASQGLREITAALYAPQLKEAPGVVEKAKDFAKGLVPEQAPAMVGAAKRVKAEKEPWQMTRKEWIDWYADSQTGPNRMYTKQSVERARDLFMSGNISDEMMADVHNDAAFDANDLLIWRKAWVKKAIEDGKPVPPEVLADYPELNATAKKTTAAGQRVKAGTWAFDREKAKGVVAELKKRKDEWYDIVGDDLFMDGIDGAIRRAEEMIKSSRKK